MSRSISPASLAIARALDTTSIDASRSGTHAAMRETEIAAQAAVVEALLGVLRLSPDQVARAMTAARVPA